MNGTHMKKMTKLTALMLAVCMTVTLLPLAALAERADVSAVITYCGDRTLTIAAGTDVLNLAKSAGTIRFTTFERKLAKEQAAA